MATFKAQVEALAGSVDSDTELGTWLSDGAIDIIHRISLVQPTMLPRFGTEATIGTSGLDVSDDAVIISVYNGTRESAEIPADTRFRAGESTSLYYATTKHPKHYFLSNKLIGLPSSANTMASVIKPPTIGATATSVAAFPDELYPQIVLYGALQNLQAKMSDLALPDDVDLPVPPIIDAFSSVSESLPTYTAIPQLVLPAIPADADVDFSGIGSDPSFTAPNAIVLPTLDLGSDLTISALSLDSVAPVMDDIDIDAGGVDAFGTAPAFVPPSLSLTTAATLSTLTLPVPPNLTDVDLASVTAPTAPADAVLASVAIDVGTVPVYAGPTKALAVATAMATVTTYVDTNEDIELAQTKLLQVQQAVNDYTAEVTNSLNQFNEQATQYQAELQKGIEEARLKQTKESQEAALRVEKYSNQVRAYVAQVNAEVAHRTTDNSVSVNLYTAGVNAVIQAWLVEEVQGTQAKWIAQRQTEISKYQQDIANELNRFNGANVEYQATIQKNITEASNQLTSESEELRTKLQEYAQLVEQYRTDVNVELQEYLQKDVASEVTEWTTKRANWLQEFQVKSTSALQQHATELNEQVQVFTAELQVWAKEIDQAIADYQAETGYDMSKYSAEAQAVVAKHAEDVRNSNTAFQAGIAKYQQDIAMITEYNQRLLVKFTQEITSYGAELGGAVGNFSAKVQKQQQQYVWYVEQYKLLSMRYESGFVPFQSPERRG